MSLKEQFLLPFPEKFSFDREDFFVASSNVRALHWIDRWPKWKTPLLTLYGPKGCGKSHLAALWQKRSNAVLIDGDTLSPETLLDLPQTLIIDHADSLIDKPHIEQNLLHGFEVLTTNQGFVLLLAQESPTYWPLRLVDLRTYLRYSPAIRIDHPEESLLAAILVKQLHDRQLRIDTNVACYLLRHMRRSFDSVRRLVATLDEVTLRDKRPITLQVARQVLSYLQASGEINNP